MLSKEGLLNLLDRMKEAIERGSEFGLVRYEMIKGEYFVNAQIRGFHEDAPDEDVRLAAT